MSSQEALHVTGRAGGGQAGGLRQKEGETSGDGSHGCKTRSCTQLPGLDRRCSAFPAWLLVGIIRSRAVGGGERPHGASPAGIVARHVRAWEETRVSRWSRWGLLSGVLVVAGGCRLNCPNWLNPGSIPYQQSRATYHDPYPDDDAAPEVSAVRPGPFRNRGPSPRARPPFATPSARPEPRKPWLPVGSMHPARWGPRMQAGEGRGHRIRGNSGGSLATRRKSHDLRCQLAHRGLRTWVAADARGNMSAPE